MLRHDDDADDNDADDNDADNNDADDNDADDNEADDKIDDDDVEGEQRSRVDRHENHFFKRQRVALHLRVDAVIPFWKTTRLFWNIVLENKTTDQIRSGCCKQILAKLYKSTIFFCRNLNPGIVKKLIILDNILDLPLVIYLSWNHLRSH